MHSNLVSTRPLVRTSNSFSRNTGCLRVLFFCFFFAYFPCFLPHLFSDLLPRLLFKLAYAAPLTILLLFCPRVPRLRFSFRHVSFVFASSFFSRTVSFFFKLFAGKFREKKKHDAVLFVPLGFLWSHPLFCSFSRCFSFFFLHPSN